MIRTRKLLNTRDITAIQGIAMLVWIFLVLKNKKETKKARRRNILNMPIMEERSQLTIGVISTIVTNNLAPNFSSERI